MITPNNIDKINVAVKAGYGRSSLVISRPISRRPVNAERKCGMHFDGLETAGPDFGKHRSHTWVSVSPGAGPPQLSQAENRKRQWADASDDAEYPCRPAERTVIRYQRDFRSRFAWVDDTASVAFNLPPHRAYRHCLSNRESTPAMANSMHLARRRRPAATPKYPHGDRLFPVADQAGYRVRATPKT